MTRYIKNLDLTLLITVISIITFGLVMVYSATYEGEGIPFEFRRQIMFFFMGLILMFVMSTIDYEIWGKFRAHLYIFTLGLLIFVLHRGEVIRDVQSWITLGPLGRFQPSEFAKLALIITLAFTISKNRREINKITVLLKIGLHMAIPVLLILIQPDLGTSLVLIAITFTMLFWTGTNPLYLLCLSVTGFAVTPFVLKDYQWRRLTIFLNPERDPTGDGWNIIQSKIAIGSGKLFGKGLLQGTQSQLQFIPEHSTDFIFSVIGEELGLAGCMLLTLAFFIVIWRGLTIAGNAKDEFGTLLGLGVVAMFTFHILVNIGMTIGIMPITGIPLPFISVGGSSLTTNLMAIGLLLSVKQKSGRTLF